MPGFLNATECRWTSAKVDKSVCPAEDVGCRLILWDKTSQQGHLVNMLQKQRFKKQMWKYSGNISKQTGFPQMSKKKNQQFSYKSDLKTSKDGYSSVCLWLL